MNLTVEIEFIIKDSTLFFIAIKLKRARERERENEMMK
jgi:hypothetical protein